MIIGLGLIACADSIEVGDELSGFGSELPRFAVLSGDDTYSSSSVGFLDADANPMAESWLHSGTTSPKLVETLGGDTAFVTEERGDGTFTVIGRFGADVVSRFDLSTGEVLGQVRVREAFAVNPYDVVYTDSGRAFAVRFGKNPNEGVSDLDAGNDLVEIDPSTAAILGLDEATGEIEGRIDLSAFDLDVAVGDSSLTTYAGPSTALEVGGSLIIGLGRYSLDYAAIGEGAFVVHDLESSTSTLVPLPGLRACENVSRVPGKLRAFAVHCFGAYGAAEPDQGVVLFELDDEGQATEIAAYREVDYPDGEVPLGSVVVLDEGRAGSGACCRGSARFRHLRSGFGDR